jgi:uncharacterized protein (DUF2384 family)
MATSARIDLTSLTDRDIEAVTPLPEYGSYQRLIARAVDVFGDPVKASRWLSIPNPDLANQTPLQVSQSDGYSTRLLEPIFVRIEHGIEG